VGFGAGRIRDEGRVTSMDTNLRRRSRERAIAAEVANELFRALGPAMMPESLGEKNREVVERVFDSMFDKHGIVTEASGARILGFVPSMLAKLKLKYAELDRQLDAAIRHPQLAGSSR
jgi:hypothetical protein